MKETTGIYPKFYLYNRIVKAKLYIDDNYCNNIDLSNISDEACFSRFHFLRLFKSVNGKTPHQYLIQVRINKAMEFLEQDFKINDTCFKVGFDSVSSFSGLFRRMHGCSPSEYQRLYKIRQANIKARPLNYIPNCFVEPIK